jgi:hypothetical protein
MGRASLWMPSPPLVLVAFAFACGLCTTASAYSVLTHETIIDSAWDGHIVPILKSRFPRGTETDLREARAYAYGGCIIQDSGYYPFGSHTFTDLAHYLRSGDFVEAMIAESRDIKELAFALGALAHYTGDNTGHPSINSATALTYPKLRRKFGNVVTFAESRSGHVRTEFGFDVVELARGRFTPEAYHGFIGFEVSKELLERAFERTYGLPLKDLFMDVDLALGTYRWAVSKLIPEMTRVAWEVRKDEIQKAQPQMTRAKFVQRFSRAEYEKEWGKRYRKPGVLAKVLSILFRIIPKFGMLKALSFHVPPPEAERPMLEGVAATQVRYRRYLEDLKANRLDLPNTILDTGEPMRAGTYPLADRVYVSLLEKLAKRDLAALPPDLARELVRFFREGAPPRDRKAAKQWRKLAPVMEQLRARLASRAAGDAGSGLDDAGTDPR